METSTVFIVLFIFFSGSKAASDCDPALNELDYNGELCITISDTTSNYTTAKEYCAGLPKSATLVVVKDEKLQEFITNETLTKFDNIWIGAIKLNGTNEYKWEDGTTVRDFYWAVGQPRNVPNNDNCISLRPVNSKTAEANWENSVCLRNYLAICQRPVNMTWDEIVSEIRTAKGQIEAIRKELEEGMNITVPVGSVYVEYSGQKSPAELWPNLQWEDVTNMYAGLFFRASGNGSEEWGVTQTECSPRINQTEHKVTTNASNTLNISSDGWSEYGITGYHMSTVSQNGVRYNTEGCEIRPKNQAIRLWKRIA